MTQTRFLIPAPAHLYRGHDLLGTVSYAELGQRVLVVGGFTALQRVRPRLQDALEEQGVTSLKWIRYGSDCSEPALAALRAQAHRHQTSGIIGIGGGKALDTAKLLAHQLQVPVTTIPTSAATCAAWTALSNIYSDDAGSFLYDVPLGQAPANLILDYDLLLTAPPRTLRAGIGDALAKWYEASVSSGASEDALVISALQHARVLRDLLFQHAREALDAPGSTAWYQVVDACICLAGVVGGLGGAQCRTVAAHAVHNGLTHLLNHQTSLHGEKVAFGILVQQRLEEILQGNQLAATARKQLLDFYREIDLPITLADLRLSRIESADLMTIARVACAPQSDIHHLPFSVMPEALVVALQTTCMDSSAAPTHTLNSILNR